MWGQGVQHETDSENSKHSCQLDENLGEFHRDDEAGHVIDACSVVHTQTVNRGWRERCRLTDLGKYLIPERAERYLKE